MTWFRLNVSYHNDQENKKQSLISTWKIAVVCVLICIALAVVFANAETHLGVEARNVNVNLKTVGR